MYFITALMESDMPLGAASTCPGTFAVVSQIGTHTNPSNPMAAKHACQLHVVAIQMNSAGPIIFAKFVPKFTTPMAIAFCDGGNHSAIDLLQAGKFGASPRPRAMRRTLKWSTLDANACRSPAKLHKVAAMP